MCARLHEREGRKEIHLLCLCFYNSVLRHTHKKKIRVRVCVQKRTSGRDGKRYTYYVCAIIPLCHATHKQKNKKCLRARVCVQERTSVRDAKRYTYYVCANITLCLTSNKKKKPTSTDHTATNALQQFATYTLRYCTYSIHTATHYNTLQHTATHCNTLQRTATHCNTLQHTTTHCNTLQHTATHCNTLQRKKRVFCVARYLLLSWPFRFKV